jgi:hypothetical protein
MSLCVFAPLREILKEFPAKMQRCKDAKGKHTSTIAFSREEKEKMKRRLDGKEYDFTPAAAQRSCECTCIKGQTNSQVASQRQRNLSH